MRPARARSDAVACTARLTSDLVPQVVCSEDESLREMVEVAVQRLYDALSPSTDTSGGVRSQLRQWAESEPTMGVVSTDSGGDDN